MQEKGSQVKLQGRQEMEDRQAFPLVLHYYKVFIMKLVVVIVSNHTHLRIAEW